MFAHILERYFGCPIASNVVVGDVISGVAVRGQWIVDLEALLRFIAGLVFRPDFGTGGRSALRTQWFDLLYQIRHDISILQIIVPLGAVSWFDLVNVVQTGQRIGRYVNSSVKN